MIGHYLLTLTQEQEDLVLVKPFHPILYKNMKKLKLHQNDAGCPGRCACLCSTVQPQSREGKIYGVVNGFYGVNGPDEDGRGTSRIPGFAYEDACMRFGILRVNSAIRNRILSNRLWRVRRTVNGALDASHLFPQGSPVQ